MVKKLNLGSGKFRKEGYVNVDYYSATEPDVIHDLNITPYPFKDDEFGLVEADHVLEHLEKPFEVMKELYRITAHKGMIVIRVPHFSRGFTHPEHRAGFDVSFPYYFNPSFEDYRGFQLILRKTRLTWFAQPYLKKSVLNPPVYLTGRIIGVVLDALGNLSPFFCSRLWCYLVGGFEEIEFQFQVSKKEGRGPKH